MNDKYKVKIDTNDSRYVNLRKALKDDLSQKVQCEDYDKIINYIFALVFEHNKPKDEVKKEIEEIFQDSADYIMDLLVNLLEKYYGAVKDNNGNDLIEEIYEEKATGSKSLSSQVIKPSPQQEQKGSKNLYNQDIDNSKEGSRRRQNQRNRYDDYEDNYQQNDRRNNYNGNNNYGYNDRNNSNNNYNYNDNRRNSSMQQQNQMRRGSYNNTRNSNYDRKNSREENINVGGRNLIIKKRRSRSRSLDRDHSKGKEEKDHSNNNHNHEIGSNNNNNTGNTMNNQGYQQGGFPQQQNHFNPNYQHGYHQNDPRHQYVNSNYFQPGMGAVFQPRRLGLFAQRGRFPGRFVKQSFMDPMSMGRMPIMRKPFLSRATAPAQNNEGANTACAEKLEPVNNQENLNIGAQEATESMEIKGVQENNAQSQQVENPADDKTNKKKVRCRNWPICKNESCEYAHPTETCQFFPKCQFGSKCLYIHPNIPCKYGFYCTRQGCAYSHGSGYNPGMFGMMPPAMKNFNANKFKKFPPKTAGKPGVNAAIIPTQDNPEGELVASQEENQIHEAINEEMNIQS